MKQVLEYPTDRINRVSSIWFQDLLHFMHTQNLKMVTKMYISLTLQRINDKYIKDEVLQSNMTKNKMIQISAGRILLRVIYLSDITKPDGKTTNPLFYSGNCPNFSTSKYRWPYQSNSSPKAWKVWTTMLRNILQI